LWPGSTRRRGGASRLGVRRGTAEDVGEVGTDSWEAVGWEGGKKAGWRSTTGSSDDVNTGLREARWNRYRRRTSEMIGPAAESQVAHAFEAGPEALGDTAPLTLKDRDHECRRIDVSVGRGEDGTLDEVDIGLYEMVKDVPPLDVPDGREIDAGRGIGGKGVRVGGVVWGREGNIVVREGGWVKGEGLGRAVLESAAGSDDVWGVWVDVAQVGKAALGLGKVSEGGRWLIGIGWSERGCRLLRMMGRGFSSVSAGEIPAYGGWDDRSESRPSVD
jgi:hypothetical protein